MALSFCSEQEHPLTKNPAILYQGVPFFLLFDGFSTHLDEKTANSLLRCTKAAPDANREAVILLLTARKSALFLVKTPVPATLSIKTAYFVDKNVKMICLSTKKGHFMDRSDSSLLGCTKTAVSRCESRSCYLFAIFVN